MKTFSKYTGLLAALCLVATPALAQQQGPFGPGPAPATSSGGGTPGGSSGDIQFNNAGALGGSAATANAAGLATVESFDFLSTTLACTASTNGLHLTAANVVTMCINGLAVGTWTSTGQNAGAIGQTTGSNGNFTNLGVTSTLKFAAVQAATATAPTLSGTGLGSSPSITNAGSLAGIITAGATPANASFTMTFSPAASHGWSCRLEDETSNASLTVGQTAHTATTAVFQAYSRTSGASGTLNASDVISYSCTGY